MVKYEPVICKSYNEDILASKIKDAIAKHIGMKIHSITNIVNKPNWYVVLIMFQYREKSIKK